MKTVILMRHGEADQAGSDYLRPLTARGKSQCLQTASEMALAGIRLDRVLCSSAVRAQSSAQLVAEALQFAGSIEAHKALYLAGPQDYLKMVRNSSRQTSTLLLVGHNPGLSALASQLRGVRIGLSTADYVIARSEVEHWADIG